MDDNRRSGGRGRRRPPWWPQDEQWPPSPGAWQAAHSRFRRRIGLVFVFIVGLMLGAWLLGSLVFDGRHEPERGWDGPPIFAIVLLIGGAYLVYRLLRRTTGPVGDLLEATGRLAAGDYSVRVHPHGPFETAELASSFNALAERLESDETRRRDLLADVTHELRTPLSVIRGAAEGIIDGVYPGNAANVAPIVEEVEMMARLLDDLATLSSAEAGQLTMHVEETPPAALIDESLAAFRPRYEAAGVALGAEVADDLPPVRVDPVRIRQVLSNLLANALHYTPRGGSVSVEATPAPGGDGVAFRVSDRGTGIAAADLPHVFERFRKAGDSDGSGLGLAIAKSLVEAHGGSIEAQSPPSHGTTIVFVLPAPKP
jgi:two-component system sensor histidine kinase BaeS